MDDGSADCDVDGNYQGAIVWTKVRYTNANTYEEWDSYPSGAHDAALVEMNSWDSSGTATILVDRATTPADDGVDRSVWGGGSWLEANIRNCGDDASGDAECNADGDYIGDYSNWAWIAVVEYTNGRIYRLPDGDFWDTNFEGHTASFAGRGNLLTANVDENVFAGDLRFLTPEQPGMSDGLGHDPIWDFHTEWYEHGLLDYYTLHGETEVYGVIDFGGYSVSEYTVEERGTQVGTYWSGTKDGEGQVMASPPPGDNELFNPCDSDNNG